MKLQNLMLTIWAFSIASSTLAQQPEKIGPIQKVIVSNGIVLQIKHDTAYTLAIKTQDLEDGCLIKTIENGTLTLKLKSGFGCRGKITADLTCPDLKRIEATGKAEVSTRNLLKLDSLSFLLRSGAQAYLDLDIKYLKIELKEGAMFSAQGYAVEQQISSKTFATFSGFKLEGDKVNVTAESGGKAKVCADKDLYAESMTGGYIGYKCNPAKKTLEPKGNGTIEEVKD